MVFYDLNFTVATFTSGNALLEATNKFFQRFPVVYEAKMECERPIFDLFPIDADKVSRIGSDYNLTVADLVRPETLLEIWHLIRRWGLSSEMLLS